jgi:DNA-binding PadR family transcriptional regulator
VSDPLQGLGRYSDPSLLILASLADGAKHGYAMTKDIERFAGVVLGPGTLYGALARLQARGLIETLPARDRRQPYGLTGQGREVLAARLREMASLAHSGLARLGLA